MLSATLVTSAGNCAAAVSKITCRKRWLVVRGIALRLTITTSAQDGSASSARTTAAPTCPVPPMIKPRNAIDAPPYHSWCVLRIGGRSQREKAASELVERSGEEPETPEPVFLHFDGVE